MPYLGYATACETATEVTISITILQAIRWIAQGCDLVKPDTIKKCYRKGSILNDFNVVRRQGEEEDPYGNIDLAVDTTEKESIMPHIQADSCPVSEYLAGEMIFKFVRNLILNIWQKNFYHHLHPQVNQCQLTHD